MTTVELAERFLKFCLENQRYRFWQALQAFTKREIFVGHDTFFDENDTVLEDTNDKR